jgi:hypothetical protein
MVSVTIDSFYQSNAVTDPPTYLLTYTVSWTPTDIIPSKLFIWGPQGCALDTISPSNLTVSEGIASFTNTINVAQQNTYLPLVSDPNFVESIWTTQSLHLQPGTYQLTITGATGITVDGFSYTAGTNITVVDDTPVVISFTGSATAVILTGTPVYTPVTDLLNNTTQPSDFYPLYVVATDVNNIVLAAVYAVNDQPYIGSPQALTSPFAITPLDNTLTPIPPPPSQPSSLLNN